MQKMRFATSPAAIKRMFQMAIQLHLEKITLKRTVARTVFYLCCLGILPTACLGVDVDSSWQALGQAKICQKMKTVVPFRPELSLEQNNQILKEHRTRTAIISTTFSTRELGHLQLVNRSVRWLVDDQVVSGRVTAIMLSEDQATATVFAEVPYLQSSNPNLSRGNNGLLSVER